MKKVLSFLLALTVVFALAACGGKGGSTAAGTYQGIHAKFVGDADWIPSEGDNAFSLTLTKDGKGTHQRDGMEFSVTWQLDGENFTMTETFMGITLQYTGTLKGGTLDLFNNDPADPLTYEYVYEKK